jgi:hypothetical protein
VLTAAATVSDYLSESPPVAAVAHNHTMLYYNNYHSPTLRHMAAHKTTSTDEWHAGVSLHRTVTVRVGQVVITTTPPSPRHATSPPPRLATPPPAM